MINITIDGPTASGKSTIARLVAKALNYTYLDTGSMYRAITWGLIQQHINLEDEQAIEAYLKKVQLEMTPDHVILDGVVVDHEIRSLIVTRNVSLVASYGAVRNYLTNKQRQFASSKGVVLDGRDIGTTVLPNAELKIYQVADVEVRAQRRYLENKKRGIDESYDIIRDDLIRRDEYDMNRQISPLVKAKDAIVIDTTHMSIEDVVNKIVDLAQKKKVGGSQ